MIPQIPRGSPAFLRVGDHVFANDFMEMSLMIPQIPHFGANSLDRGVRMGPEEERAKCGGSAGSCPEVRGIVHPTDPPLPLWAGDRWGNARGIRT